MNSQSAIKAVYILFLIPQPGTLNVMQGPINSSMSILNQHFCSIEVRDVSMGKSRLSVIAA